MSKSNDINSENVNLVYKETSGNRKTCIIPDDITFIRVLSASMHAGMLKEGLISFELMQKLYKLEPKVQHYHYAWWIYAQPSRTCRKSRETHPKDAYST
ncbi:hypothetical protein MTR_4g024260 [Medicago truncatula]|uniref:Uncharacterized protein n=1 Tax=Medicago truncatula TaxID=3880 RepID=G7JEL9_MEDTR|nr:hypothetical protein MTR_4g024260 [Medicago truncatula]